MSHPEASPDAQSNVTRLFLCCILLTPPFMVQAQAPLFESKLAGSGIEYRNRAGSPEKRYIVSSLGAGAALFDYDHDGDLDLYLVNGAAIDSAKTISYPESNRLYRNEGAFTFTDVTDAAGVADSSWGYGCAVGDFDNDGFVDLYVTNLDANRLFRNRGDGTFEAVGTPAEVEDESWGASAAFVDVNNDSFLDLYVSNYVVPDLETLASPGEDPTCQWLGLDVMCGPRGLEPARDRFFLNQGDGGFTDATSATGFGEVEPSFGLGVVVADYDLDGDSDLYVANDTMPNFLFQNQGDGTVEEVGFLSGVAYNDRGEPEAGMGVDFADWNGDGRPDLFVTNFSHETNTAYQNSEQRLFSEVTDSMNLALPSLGLLGWSARFADFDLDGYLDLFIVNGHVYPEVAKTDPEALFHEPNQIFWGREGTFELGQFGPGQVMSELRSSRGAAFGDIDEDGQPDIVVVNMDDEISLIRNRSGGNAHWLRVYLVGVSTNRDGVGARVTLDSGERQWTRQPHVSGSFLSANDGRTLFGLGKATSVESLSVHWPNGKTDRIESPPIDGTLIVKEGVGRISFLLPVE